MEKILAENQNQQRAAKPFCNINTNTVKNASFTLNDVIVNTGIKFLFDFLVPKMSTVHFSRAN